MHHVLNSQDGKQEEPSAAVEEVDKVTDARCPHATNARPLTPKDSTCVCDFLLNVPVSFPVRGGGKHAFVCSGARVVIVKYACGCIMSSIRRSNSSKDAFQ